MPKWVSSYDSFEWFFAEVVDFDLEFDVIAG